MSRYSDYFEPLGPEEVDEFLATVNPAEILALEHPGADDLENLFRVREALVLTGQEEEAAKMIPQIKPVILKYLEHGDDREKGLQYFTDWSLYMIGITPETSADFVCMHFYHDLFDAFAQSPETGMADLQRTKLQLLHHYESWLSGGGIEENLDEADLAFIQQIRENTIPETEALIRQSDESGDFKLGYELRKALQRFYLYRQKPNESMRWLKEAMEILPKTPEYEETKLADLNFEMGRTLISYRKYEAAERYFQRAYEIFERAGEEYEIRMYQAEGFLEECQARKGS